MNMDFNLHSNIFKLIHLELINENNIVFIYILIYLN